MMDKENNNKTYDLLSVMKLLKSQQVPTELKAMKQVSYSAIQMFAASNLANTQILSKHFEDFNALKKTVNDLSQSLKHQKIQNEQQENTINSLKSQINKLSNSIHQNPTPKSPNKSALINSQLTEQLIGLQNVIHVHGKKISELIKRYKKDHSELNNLKKQVSDISTKYDHHETSSRNKSKNASSSTMATTSDASDDSSNEFEYKLKELSKSLNSLETETKQKLDEMKADLSGHEEEHEGIINEIINQMDNMKSGLETKIDSISNEMNNDEIIQEIFDEKCKGMINNKLMKFEKIMSKLINDMHKVKSRPSSARTKSASSSKLSRPNTADSANNVSHHRIISVDLKMDKKQPKTSEDVVVISKPTDSKEMNHGIHGNRKRRIRSTSFNEFDKSKVSRSNSRGFRQ